MYLYNKQLYKKNRFKNMIRRFFYIILISKWNVLRMKWAQYYEILRRKYILCSGGHNRIISIHLSRATNEYKVLVWLCLSYSNLPLSYSPNTIEMFYSVAGRPFPPEATCGVFSCHLNLGLPQSTLNWVVYATLEFPC